MFVIFLLMMSFGLAQWKLIDQSLTDQTLTINQDGWTSQNVEIGTCDTNGEQQIILDSQDDLILKSIPISVWKVQVIFDLYYDFPQVDTSSSKVSVNLIQSNGNLNISTLLIELQKQRDQLKQQSTICRNDEQDYPFEFSKVVTPKLEVSQKNFSISVQFSPATLGNKIRIRNFQVYGFFCKSFCKTCDESNPSICLSCLAKDQIPPNCVCPMINQPTSSYITFYQEGYGCIYECSRDYYLPDDQLICQKDLRVSSKLNFLNPQQSLSNIQEISITSLSLQNFISYCYNSHNEDYIAGPFQTQTISLPLGSVEIISYIRMRINLYFMQFYDQSYIQISLDSVQQLNIMLNGKTYQRSHPHKFQNLQFENVEPCQDYAKFDNIYRFELIMYPLTNNPTLQFTGSMSSSSSQWGFSNITIDYGVCQLNCKFCLDETSCQVCNVGYFLLGNECINKCPIFSNDCLDYVDEIPFSKYLVKAFYDSNMTFDNIISHFDTITETVVGKNFLTGANFSMIQDKFVLGGLLVWNNAKYTKTYTINSPHYALSIRFNITFGDDFNGAFTYYLDSQKQQQIDRVRSEIEYNLIGKASKESVVFVYQYYQHTRDKLKIEFECKTDQDLKDGFCSISEYFIVVHNCVTGCQACTSIDVCTINNNIAICPTPKYWNYDQNSGSYQCQDCSLNYCKQCATAILCKQCQEKFSLNHGQCFCDESQYRTVVSSMCICKTGYYEDQYTQRCKAICGDGLIMEEEECDDGNLYPFDGCHQCKYICQSECLNCIKGKCQNCQIGYTLILNQCYPECKFDDLKSYHCQDYRFNKLVQQQQESILVKESKCGDQIVDPFIEECEDNNIQPFDGCFVCQYSCPENCQTCVFGICLQCNENWSLANNQCISVCGNEYVQANEQCDNRLAQTQLYGCYNCKCVYGYNMIDKKCQSICGDGYQTMDEECDDANSIQHDGCHLCMLECLNCNICVKGQCQQCQSGYYKDDEQLCKLTYCGDSIKQGQEQCDDGNLIQLDGCQDCQCEQGWISNSTNKCSSICGDGLIVKGEQCDDANNIQFDGCYLCQFDCNVQCTECLQGICKACKYGYNLIGNNCVNTCGDGILDLSKEQCDDQNLVSRDGCTNCQLEPGYICFHDNLIFNHCELCKDSNCSNCVIINDIQQCKLCKTGYFVDQFQACSLCDKLCIDCITTSKNCINYNYDVYQIKKCDSKSGFYYDYQLKDCVSLCGDGIIAGSENCDDNNHNDFDGCSSKCLIEPGYLFDQKNNYFIIEPNVQVEFESKNNNQYSIIADQEQQAINCSGTTLHIENFKTTDYNYTILESDVKCDLDIQYFQTVEPINLIHIIIKYKGQYIKRILDDESVKEVIIVPQRQVYVSELQQQQGEQMAQTSKTISQSLLILGPLAVLAGGFQFIWAVLDILSWMNNFYFLNVTYPENVRQIFLYASWDNIIEFPSVDTFNNQNDPYYFQSPAKFDEKGIDPLFFNNIQTTLIFLVQVIGTKLICKSIRRILERQYKIQQTTSRLQLMKFQSSIFRLNNSASLEIKPIDLNQQQYDQKLDQQQQQIEDQQQQIEDQQQQQQIQYQQQQQIEYQQQQQIEYQQQQQIEYQQQQIDYQQQEQQQQYQIDKIVQIDLCQDVNQNNKQQKQNKKIPKTQQQSPNISQQYNNIPSFFQSTYKNCVQFDECFIANLLKTIQISFLDLTLAISLQITNQQTRDYLVVKINIIFAYVCILLLFYLLNFSYQISVTHQKQLQNKHFNDRFSCFYEELKTNDRMAMCYSFVNLVRKVIFTISTVIFYQTPIYQTSICFLSCAINILFLLQGNPFESKQQYILNLIPDLSVLIVVGITIILAFQDNFIMFNDDLIYQLGWAIGGCIYASIGLQLLFLIKEILMKVYQKLKNLIEQLRKK